MTVSMGNTGMKPPEKEGEEEAMLKTSAEDPSKTHTFTSSKDNEGATTSPTSSAEASKSSSVAVITASFGSSRTMPATLTPTPNVKMAGFLEKRGKRLPTWKTYWFVLEGRLLLYFRSQFDYLQLSPCRGSLNLGLVSAVRPLGSQSAPQLELVTRSQAVLLRTKERATQERWLQALLDAIQMSSGEGAGHQSGTHFRGYSNASLPKVGKRQKGSKFIDEDDLMENPSKQRVPTVGVAGYGSLVKEIQNLSQGGLRPTRARSPSTKQGDSELRQGSPALDLRAQLPTNKAVMRLLERRQQEEEEEDKQQHVTTIVIEPTEERKQDELSRSENKPALPVNSKDKIILTVKNKETEVLDGSVTTSKVHYKSKEQKSESCVSIDENVSSTGKEKTGKKINEPQKVDQVEAALVENDEYVATPAVVIEEGPDYETMPENIATEDDYAAIQDVKGEDYATIEEDKGDDYAAIREDKEDDYEATEEGKDDDYAVIQEINKIRDTDLAEGYEAISEIKSAEGDYETLGDMGINTEPEIPPRRPDKENKKKKEEKKKAKKQPEFLSEQTSITVKRKRSFLQRMLGTNKTKKQKPTACKNIPIITIDAAEDKKLEEDVDYDQVDYDELVKQTKNVEEDSESFEMEENAEYYKSSDVQQSLIDDSPDVILKTVAFLESSSSNLDDPHATESKCNIVPIISNEKTHTVTIAVTDSQPSIRKSDGEMNNSETRPKLPTKRSDSSGSLKSELSLVRPGSPYHDIPRNNSPVNVVSKRQSGRESIGSIAEVIKKTEGTVHKTIINIASESARLETSTPPDLIRDVAEGGIVPNLPLLNQNKDEVLRPILRVGSTHKHYSADELDILLLQLKEINNAPLQSVSVDALAPLRKPEIHPEPDYDIPRPHPAFLGKLIDEDEREGLYMSAESPTEKDVYYARPLSEYLQELDMMSSIQQVRTSRANEAFNKWSEDSPDLIPTPKAQPLELEEIITEPTLVHYNDASIELTPEPALDQNDNKSGEIVEGVAENSKEIDVPESIIPKGEKEEEIIIGNTNPTIEEKNENGDREPSKVPSDVELVEQNNVEEDACENRALPLTTPEVPLDGEITSNSDKILTESNVKLDDTKEIKEFDTEMDAIESKVTDTLNKIERNENTITGTVSNFVDILEPKTIEDEQTVEENVETAPAVTDTAEEASTSTMSPSDDERDNKNDSIDTKVDSQEIIDVAEKIDNIAPCLHDHAGNDQTDLLKQEIVKADDDNAVSVESKENHDTPEYPPADQKSELVSEPEINTGTRETTTILITETSNERDIANEDEEEVVEVRDLSTKNLPEVRLSYATNDTEIILQETVHLIKTPFNSSTFELDPPE